MKKTSLKRFSDLQVFNIKQDRYQDKYLLISEDSNDVGIVQTMRIQNECEMGLPVMMEEGVKYIYVDRIFYFRHYYFNDNNAIGTFQDNILPKEQFKKLLIDLFLYRNNILPTDEDSLLNRYNEYCTRFKDIYSEEINNSDSSSTTKEDLTIPEVFEENVKPKKVKPLPKTRIRQNKETEEILGDEGEEADDKSAVDHYTTFFKNMSKDAKTKEKKNSAITFIKDALAKSENDSEYVSANEVYNYYKNTYCHTFHRAPSNKLDFLNVYVPKVMGVKCTKITDSDGTGMNVLKGIKSRLDYADIKTYVLEKINKNDSTKDDSVKNDSAKSNSTIMPKFISKWSDDDLITVMDLYKNSDAEDKKELMKILGVKNFQCLYAKIYRIKAEIKERGIDYSFN